MSFTSRSASATSPPAIVDAPKKWPTELLRLISEATDDWEAIFAYLKLHPDEAKNVGRLMKNTPLHVAVIRYPPLIGVQTLLKLAPEAGMHQNKDGETPLHIAVTCAPEQVQLELIRVAPQAIGLQDQDGDTPLHIAAKNGATLLILHEMLRHSPETVQIVNKRGITPFCLLSRSWVHAESLQDIYDDEDYQVDWQAAMTFVRSHPRASASMPLVHAACMNPAIPKPLVQMLLKFYPDQVATYDDEGNTPLHYAAVVSAIASHPPPECWNSDMDGYREELHDEHDLVALTDMQLSHSSANTAHLQRLLRPTLTLDSSTVAILVSFSSKLAHMANRHGQLPLVLAIQADRGWDQGLSNLVWAAPRALETRDPLTRLYPYQLAALHSSSLDTVYNLLRCYPQHLKVELVEDMQTNMRNK